ncbi:hypothetical protein F2Q68_00037815, partial [Brassica cretica]
SIAIRICSTRKKPKDAKALGEEIASTLPTSEIVDSCSVTGPGFINVVISADWMAKSIERMLVNGIETWAPTLSVKRAVVDFCSPNIAKQMHGTQFGMLIEHLFESGSADSLTTIEDLQSLYRQSKDRFTTDPVFKAKAQQAVVRLQGGDLVYLKPWARICEISRAECAKAIQRLHIEQLEEKGESFYQPYIPNLVKDLDSMGLIEEDDGARVIYIQGFAVPLMLVKSDGGFSYDTTDLSALWYRLYEEIAEWIVYVTDAGQQDPFYRLFGAARKVGLLPSSANTYPLTSHAKNRSKAALIKRAEEKEIKWTLEELDQTSEAVGYGAVKYADLKNNRSTSYAFNYDLMLSDKGNTAVYLLYTYTPIHSIIRMSGKDIDELKKTGKIALDLADERALGLGLVQFPETVEEACTKLLPNLLCEYLYNLSELCTKFYTSCKVNGSVEETSRLLLCEATATVMVKCFHLLGITPVYKM